MAVRDHHRGERQRVPGRVDAAGAYPRVGAVALPPRASRPDSPLLALRGGARSCGVISPTSMPHSSALAFDCAPRSANRFAERVLHGSAELATLSAASFPS